MKTYVIGGGGHAKVVLATLQAAGREVGGVLDDDPRKHGHRLLGFPILGPTSARQRWEGDFIVAIGDNQTRKRVVEAIGDVAWASVVHPQAVVHESVVLGVGTVVFAGAVVQPDTHVGTHAIVNTGATIDHDGRLGSFTHIAPGAHLAGDVTVSEGGFVGVGASVLPGRSVGAWAIVGGGSVVVQDIPPHTTAVGVPARASN